LAPPEEEDELTRKESGLSDDLKEKITQFGSPQQVAEVPVANTTPEPKENLKNLLSNLLSGEALDQKESILRKQTLDSDEHINEEAKQRLHEKRI